MGNRNDGLIAHLVFDEFNENFQSATCTSFFFKSHPPKIKEIRFSGPATIVFFEDNTKQVVKYSEEDPYGQDKYIGVLWALAEKCSVGPYKKFKSKNQLIKFVYNYTPMGEKSDPCHGLWHIVHNEFVENGPYADTAELNSEINNWIADSNEKELTWKTFMDALYNWLKEN